jgi:hypothetical protein
MTVKLVDAFGQMLEEEMARRGVEVEFGVTTENLPLVLEEMVTVELMAQEAVRRGYAKEPAVAAALAWQERRALAEELQERLFAPLEASQQDIMQYFTQHRDEFGYGLKVQWMVLADTLLGRALLDSVNAGVDFAGLARRHSLDTTITPATFLRRSVGMALNWSLADEEAVFALRPGQVSGIINLPKGCQLVKVLERKRIVDVVTYNDAVHEYISGALTLDKQRAARDSLISELRKAAKVELTPEAYFRQAD